VAASAKHLKAHDEAHAQAAAALADGHRKLCDKVEKVRMYAFERRYTIHAEGMGCVRIAVESGSLVVA
jgi:hypothetical protein